MAAARRQTLSEFRNVEELAHAYEAGRINEADLVEALCNRSYKPTPNPALHPSVDYPVAEEGSFGEITALFTLKRIPDAAYFRIRRHVLGK